MSMMFKPHRHEPTEPQLAAMIDVFSILIIFLIAGTVMGTSSVLLPAELTPPTSVSRETMMSVPQITILPDQVQTSFNTNSYSLSGFLTREGAPEDVTRFKSDVAALVAASQGKENAGILNLVADRSTSYEKIFSVIKAAREAGAESILFVALSGQNHE